MNMGTYIIMLLLVILSMLREREIRPVKLGVIPLLLLWGVSSSIQPGFLSSPLHLMICGVLLIIGLAFGFSIGKMLTIRIHPENGKITSRGSIGSVILIVTILALRVCTRVLLPGDNEIFTAITHSLLFIPLGTITGRNVMLYKHYIKLKNTKMSIE
ncbi:DUF1453 domain-containing protein [Bacillus atrophaeus]|uniref:DUF1453 domain-containing protein n=1 Tax=Bacillus atrophaeus TaxID=1452 RepID=UPI00227E2804|nr:DUF1453 domain-containing protein [Bacillus atrophaeus]MCY8816099.1 DUF1453 domain-containing protein [Bacillus atrophaeus]